MLPKMDTDQASEQTRRQRELRRKKILENAKSRMEKLKRQQERRYLLYEY